MKQTSLLRRLKKQSSDFRKFLERHAKKHSDIIRRYNLLMLTDHIRNTEESHSDDDDNDLPNLHKWSRTDEWNRRGWWMAVSSSQRISTKLMRIQSTKDHIDLWAVTLCTWMYGDQQQVAHSGMPCWPIDQYNVVMSQQMYERPVPHINIMAFYPPGLAHMPVFLCAQFVDSMCHLCGQTPRTNVVLHCYHLTCDDCVVKWSAEFRACTVQSALT